MKATKPVLKDLWVILAVELLCIPLVIAYFSFIEPKKVAAVVAAVTFVVGGIFILLKSRRWIDGYASFTYWANHVQLFLFSIPMLLGRVAFWDREFENIKFLVFKGPDYHQLAEKIYLLLIVGTIIDITVHTVKYRRNSSKDR